MANDGDIFASSDAVRSARPLRYARSVTFPQPLTLEHGGQLPGVTVAYETYGQLNAAADNAVLVCHALSGDSHVARHDAEDDPGWWDLVVGPGKVLDTKRCFVICPNILGSCRGTTGPISTNPATGKPYGADFPVITVGDMVEVQRRLIDHLGIQQLRAVVGGSLGGHQALTWATRFPGRLQACAAIATSPRLTSQALAFDVVGRNCIIRDPNFYGGQYYESGLGPSVGLALARMLGHITYLSREAMMAKFDVSRRQPRDIATEFEKTFSVGSYLAYQGHKFVERFDANSYITLSMAMDLFDLGDTPRKLRAALAATTCRWLVLSFTSDWLFPPFQGRQIMEALLAEGKRVSYCNVESSCGHDAFLLEDNLPVYGALLQNFLGEKEGKGIDGGWLAANKEPSASPLKSAAPAPSPQPPATSSFPDPTSIFHANRLDYELILRLIPEKASVLDVGCGNGDLLALLRQRGYEKIVGVELDEQGIIATVGRGLDVVQMDLNEGLAGCADGQFDVVVLSQTLQTIADTQRIMAEILRVGRRAIVSFPNFAYRRLRQMLYEQGKSPKAGAVYSHEWYNTPNRRFPSIADFQDFCRTQGIKIHRQVYLDTEAGRQVSEDPNLNADVAIFVISR